MTDMPTPEEYDQDNPEQSPDQPGVTEEPPAHPNEEEEDEQPEKPPDQAS